MTMPTETLIIRLPAAAARRLHRVAEISRRPVDEVIAQTLQSNLPPLLEDMTSTFQEDRAALETLPTSALRQQMRAELAPESLDRYDNLLAANTDGTLDEAGREELARLRTEADRLMFRKAYAAVLLKWRGERVPTLAELESEP